jgi:DNA-binding response OmpR family regulator
MNMKEPKSEARKRVLVVDSDQDFRRYIIDCVEAEGISCISATSVSEALEALERNEVSLLIVDWFLDRVATEVVRKARSISALLPIIVMSGKPYNVKVDALLADADEFLEKTLGGSVLANRVKRWMGRLEAAPDVFLPQREADILVLDEVKYRYIQHVVQLVGNNISVAAHKLGVHRQTISAAMTAEDINGNKTDNSSETNRLSTIHGGSDTNDRE